jgi:hypothetical protein
VAILIISHPTINDELKLVLIGIEIALGLLITLPFNLKKLIIPSTIFMLSFFCVHLIIEISTVGNKGNCGCFGSLLPMTPLQALIKNLISITTRNLKNENLNVYHNNDIKN